MRHFICFIIRRPWRILGRATGYTFSSYPPVPYCGTLKYCTGCGVSKLVK